MVFRVDVVYHALALVLLFDYFIDDVLAHGSGVSSCSAPSPVYESESVLFHDFLEAAVSLFGEPVGVDEPDLWVFFDEAGDELFGVSFVFDVGATMAEVECGVVVADGGGGEFCFFVAEDEFVFILGFIPGFECGAADGVFSAFHVFLSLGADV